MRAHWHRLRERFTLPAAARAEQRRDTAGLPAVDPGTDAVLPALMDWLCLAQDCSTSHDGGVARVYSLIDGWDASYPETTGYIVPTFLEYARRTGRAEFRERAVRMTDWLVTRQFPEGGFPGGKVGSQPVVPVVFNTGQILLGLAAMHAEAGRYLEPMRRAADWLVAVQDADGCWRRHNSPFAGPGEKRYKTHVAWALFEAERLDPARGYVEAGLRNVRWALAGMHANGWLPQCCLTDPSRPLTHTLGYALRGVLEAHRFDPRFDVLDAAERLGHGLLSALRDDGFLPGRLDAGWSAAADWACLTGTAQVAHCWLLLYMFTGQDEFRRAAQRGLRYVRRAVRLDGPQDTLGAVKGSFPVDGAYGRFEYVNWAAKFLVDALLIESDLTTPAR